MSASETVALHRLGPIDQIPIGEGRAFEVAGHDIAVFRLRSGGLAATQAECPHRAGPLADGIVGMDSVVCPLHAWRFAFVTGQAEVGDCDIAVHPCRIDADGHILVTVPATSPE